MVEGDSGTGESLLYRGRDASSIAVGRDGNRAAIVHLN